MQLYDVTLVDYYGTEYTVTIRCEYTAQPEYVLLCGDVYTQTKDPNRYHVSGQYGTVERFQN